MKKEMYIDILRLLRDAARMKNQKLVSPSQQCSSTPVGSDQGCLSKEQFEDTGASPILT
jgi:hypothetical protein